MIRYIRENREITKQEADANTRRKVKFYEKRGIHITAEKAVGKPIPVSARRNQCEGGRSQG